MGEWLTAAKDFHEFERKCSTDFISLVAPSLRQVQNQESSSEHSEEATDQKDKGLEEKGRIVLAARAGISNCSVRTLNPGTWLQRSCLLIQVMLLKSNKFDMKTIQIAIDGLTSRSGRVRSLGIVKDFGYTYLDTGAMYRAATYCGSPRTS